MTNRSRFSLRALRRAVALLFLALVALPGPALAQPVDPDSPELVASVTLVTSAATVQGCAVTTVDVWINDVSALYGADVRVRFDPARLQVVDQDALAYGTQIQPLAGFLKPDFVMRRLACNVLDSADPNCDAPEEVGTIWYAATQLNPTPEAEGSGAIARISFRAIAPGQSPLEITYSKLSDRSGVQIPNTEADAQLLAEPLFGPAVDIAKLDAAKARLSWPAVFDAPGYRVYRSSLPYFSPADPPWGTTGSLQYDDPAALGSTVEEYYYVVKSACSDGYASPHSNRVGAFDFDLIPGS